MSLFAKQEETVLSVTGMHCPKCVARVTEALEGVDGVTKAEVSLEENRATVTGNAAPDALIAAITAVGFEAAL